MAGRIWVYLERGPGGILEESAAAVSFAAPAAQRWGLSLEGVCIGGSAFQIADAALGLERVLHLQGEGLEDFRAKAYGNAMEALMGDDPPELIVFPSTTQGEDLASWIGAAYHAGVLLGARSIKREGEGYVASRVEFEGKVEVDYLLKGRPVCITTEGQGPEGPSLGSTDVEVVAIPTAGAAEDATRIIHSDLVKRTVNLKDAKVIVAVGAGVGDEGTFQKVRELADLLKGELGATRAAVDAGWLSHDRQIGQTGAKVRPDLYVACGISGAAQHRVGMIESGTIVSINIDPNAPIFRYSHYCIEGDLREVVPKLIDLLKG
jgi:electron transfer flavoprotein alpha subunit